MTPDSLRACLNDPTDDDHPVTRGTVRRAMLMMLELIERQPPRKVWLLEWQATVNHPTHRFLYSSEEAGRTAYNALGDSYSRHLMPLFVEES